jgi:hypothetical protein
MGIWFSLFFILVLDPFGLKAESESLRALTNNGPPLASNKNTFIIGESQVPPCEDEIGCIIRNLTLKFDQSITKTSHNLDVTVSDVLCSSLIFLSTLESNLWDPLGSGMNVSISNMGLTCSGNWKYQLHTLPHVPKDSGTMKIGKFKLFCRIISKNDVKIYFLQVFIFFIYFVLHLPHSFHSFSFASLPTLVLISLCSDFFFIELYGSSLDLNIEVLYDTSGVLSGVDLPLCSPHLNMSYLELVVRIHSFLIFFILFISFLFFFLSF